ncbi:YcgL domain-containing protein [Neptunomonas phycophila]|uniref:YcgL domain-containing protein Q4490_03210 n=1 Tax=Neptunomonas phycophila TaxID=1572645 RepID=A0AAW7XI65_9GAMM|nr:YcgL domain-containing protein [Neptunomonas phycophila]MBT3146775.1 YcgL domain-containing protein [Neptunomonas phycophila]MDO6452565.1 YcgL domain-containing protein [Neptunomonas phycophila]QLE98219.1 YcgL domain-containing protein [Neptunomonas phycophila]
MLICSIYKSSKKDEMYLYVDKRDVLTAVPEELMAMFGTAIHVMDMPMKEGRKLARVDVQKVLAGIADKGYFLQMPPPKDDYMLDLFKGRPESGVR